MFRGTFFTTTDAQGRYQSIELNAATNPYYVYAYKDLTYHERHYCLRMAGDPEPYQEAFNATAGAVRNFRWKIQGPSDFPNADDGSAFWGGSLALENAFTDPDVAIDTAAKVEVTLVPDGPLIDGSTGSTVRRTVTFSQGVRDVPAGYYTLTAALVQDDGSRAPLRVGRSSSEAALAASMKLLFDGFDTCGHSGTFRTTHFWLARP